MARQTFIDQDREYSVAVEEDVPLGSRTNALLTALLRDEITGAPVNGASVRPIAVSLQKRGSANITARVSSDGVCGLAGVPQNLFPRLDTQSYHIGIQVDAAGYLPRKVVGEIPSDSSFPDSFNALDLGEIYLHRLPTVIRGRVVKRGDGGSSTEGCGGVRVRVTGIRRSLPPANVVSPPVAADLISISPPLYKDRKAVETAVRAISLTESPADVMELLSPSMAREVMLQVNNGEGLNAGDILIVNSADPEIRELHEIASVEGALDPSGPARIFLQTHLAWSHARGTKLKKVSVSSMGTAVSLSADSVMGDSVAFCTSLDDLDGASAIEISNASNEKEFHWLRHYDVTSDTNGDYRFPPISRVAQLIIEATHEVEGTVTHIVSPLYNTPEQYLDFVLPD